MDTPIISECCSARNTPVSIMVCATEIERFKRAFELLSKIEKKSRPRKRKTLVQYLASIFQKKLTAAENERIVEWLFSNNRVSEANNALTYQF